ncbi:MAG: DUF962 domain-containing protein [candidate division KSB1 bacterium]|nr:DUF962 domain-containing protein [candidate division KSB1 bacterium]MDZ7273851.1 DUF962 domain-containing protein [candidate division KSB1 bacterium]MDZ7286007.1 DUF962 domain-containing protein [candidate division KSB1 bacterium]MDZ7299039.1 DUF962 domain-containing protein [candidate division KSB1 bacterium]MDZ7307990.1 DUF962 domain-containing protein [candidate division KSB1 bacterium]
MRTFAEFWPFYLGEHAAPANRWLHFTGTSLALVQIIFAVATQRFWLLLTGYALAWAGHFLLEKNRPATFTYPLYSFLDEWKMWTLMLTGRLQQEGQKLGWEKRKG